MNCLCGAVRSEVAITLPASAELCHCNPCRLTTGALFGAFTDLPGPPDSDVLKNCSFYASSNVLNRHFCSTCGTKLFVEVHGKDEKDSWVLFGGALDPPQSIDNVLHVDTNEFVSDTMDGGMAPFMSQLGGRDVVTDLSLGYFRLYR